MNVKLDSAKITWTSPLSTTIGTVWPDQWYTFPYKYDRYQVDELTSILGQLRTKGWSKESDGALSFELPGIDKDSVELAVNEGRLSLKFKDRSGKDVVVPDYKLQDNVDIDTLEVSIKDGLLLVQYQLKKSKKLKVNY